MTVPSREEVVHKHAWAWWCSRQDAAEMLDAQAREGYPALIGTTHDETCCEEHAWQEQPLGSVCECDAHDPSPPCPGRPVYWTVSDD